MSVEIEPGEHVVTVRLNWPEHRNALDAPRALELHEALTEAQSTGHRAIVLAGNETAFCSGGDLRFFLGVTGESEEHVRDLIGSVYQPLIRTIVQSEIPVLAAVDGPAIGLGMDLALACDACFLGSGGWLMQGWARAGLIPGAGGLYFLNRRLPRHQVWELLVDQDRLGPAAAAAAGLGSDASGMGAEPAALAFAHRIAAMPPEAVVAYKRLMRGLDDSLSQHLTQAQALQASLLTGSAFGVRVRDILGLADPDPGEPDNHSAPAAPDGRPDNVQHRT